MTLEARPVIKNKFWIVEEQGKQVATIQAAPDGVVLVTNTQREKFSNIKLLSNKYNIRLDRAVKGAKPTVKSQDIYGYPTCGKPYNEIYDVRRKLPFFTKTAKSKSFYCAGYYAIKINGRWEEQFCPKSISVRRYPFKGPYKTSVEVQQAISESQH